MLRYMINRSITSNYEWTSIHMIHAIMLHVLTIVTFHACWQLLLQSTTALSKHVVTRMRKLVSQNGGQKHLESTKGQDLCFVSSLIYQYPLNVWKFSTKRFKTSANEAVTSCTYEDNVITHDTHKPTTKPSAYALGLISNMPCLLTIGLHVHVLTAVPMIIVSPTDICTSKPKIAFMPFNFNLFRSLPCKLYSKNGSFCKIHYYISVCLLVCSSHTLLI